MRSASRWDTQVTWPRARYFLCSSTIRVVVPTFCCNCCACLHQAQSWLWCGCWWPSMLACATCMRNTIANLHTSCGNAL